MLVHVEIGVGAAVMMVGLVVEGLLVGGARWFSSALAELNVVDMGVVVLVEMDWVGFVEHWWRDEGNWTGRGQSMVEVGLSVGGGLG